MSESLRATVVITTKNRRQELRAAVVSAVGQSARPEVLVIDDGSTDGTAEMIRGEFGGEAAVRLVRHEVSAGYIARRNEGARLALAPVIFSIDDDAAFDSPHTVEQTLGEFDRARVGAVAIPFVNVRQDRRVHQRGGAPGVQVAAWYIGTAHALRRDLFLSLGGYRERLVHQGEELDYCLRMLAAGYVVRLGSGDPIHHFESPRRDYRRMDYYGRRNDVLFAWHNVPMPELVVHLSATTVNGAIFGLRRGRPWQMARGLAAGWLAMARLWSDRRPVPRAAYRLFRLLKAGGPISIEEVEAYLRPLEEPAKAELSTSGQAARAGE